MPKTKLYNPYRSFYLFLELLHMKEEFGYDIKEIKMYLYKNTNFPDIHSTPIRDSLIQLSKYGLLSYSKNISDFEIELKGTLDDLIYEFNNGSFHVLGLPPYLEISLDDIYSSSINTIYNIFNAFFDERYMVKYDPKSRKILIELNEEKKNFGEDSVTNFNFSTPVGRQLAKISH